MALTTIAAVKAFLNITDNSQDTWLTALQLAAEASVKDYCGQNLESATYTEYHSGSNTRTIVLKQKPVTSITSLWVDNDGFFGTGPSPNFSSDNLLTAGVDYTLQLDGSISGTPVSQSGIVWRINTAWNQNERLWMPRRLYNPPSPALGNIKVTYVAGYTTIPQDIQYAVCLMVSTFKNTATYGGTSIKREKIGPLEYELFRPIMTRIITMPDFGTLRQLLSRYRDPVI